MSRAVGKLALSLIILRRFRSLLPFDESSSLLDHESTRVESELRRSATDTGFVDRRYQIRDEINSSRESRLEIHTEPTKGIFVCGKFLGWRTARSDKKRSFRFITTAPDEFIPRSSPVSRKFAVHRTPRLCLFLFAPFANFPPSRFESRVLRVFSARNFAKSVVRFENLATRTRRNGRDVEKTAPISGVIR